MLPEPKTEQSRRLWRTKFVAAFRGLRLGIKGHSSFFVHFFMSALVLATATVLKCELWQWCVLLICISSVLGAELFNSAIETLFRGLDDEIKQHTWPALDVAAGAVLLISLFAAMIGGMIFTSRLLG
ncbi:MAG: diacylglycerol kinase family protein [Planctomycetia bacterium]|nr:diacylglycerol kinase family protein [Planctomycetia bacterium]